jgi:hypothetical protein
VVIVAAPGQDRSSLWWRATSLSAPWLMRRWRRRPWSACVLRTLQHLVATEACQVHSAAAYSGHLVWRLMASFVLFYPSRGICTGRVTLEEIVCSLKHYWRFVDSEALALQGLSWGTSQSVACIQPGIMARKSQEYLVLFSRSQERYTTWGDGEPVIAFSAPQSWQYVWSLPLLNFCES